MRVECWAFSLPLSLGCATAPLPRTTLDVTPPRMVSAFFGLDDAMPEASRRLCWSGAGKDGMPVTWARNPVTPR